MSDYSLGRDSSSSSCPVRHSEDLDLTRGSKTFLPAGLDANPSLIRHRYAVYNTVPTSLSRTLQGVGPTLMVHRRDGLQHETASSGWPG